MHYFPGAYGRIRPRTALLLPRCCPPGARFCLVWTDPVMGRRGRHRGRRATWPRQTWPPRRRTRRAARVVVLVAVLAVVVLVVLAVLLTR